MSHPAFMKTKSAFLLSLEVSEMPLKVSKKALPIILKYKCLSGMFVGPRNPPGCDKRTPLIMAGSLGSASHCKFGTQYIKSMDSVNVS